MDSSAHTPPAPPRIHAAIAASALCPIGTTRSLSPLPTHRTNPASACTSSIVSADSSLTRTPVA